MSDETGNPPADAAEKAADEVKEAAADVVEVVPDPVTETADDPITPDVNERIDTLTEKVDSLVEQISGLVAAPLSPEMPGDGEVITDDTPLGVPWTHRNPFRRGD